MKLCMLISLKARRKVSLMNTSKKVALTEAAQVQDQSHLTNGQDLKTDPDMVEDTTGTEASMTAAVTDVEVEAEAEVITRDLEVALITVMEGVVATTEVDEAEEDTMTGGIIVEEEVEVMEAEVMAVEGSASSSRPTVNTNSQINNRDLATSRITTSKITTSSSKFHKLRTHLSNSNSTTPTRPTTSTTTTTRDTKQAQDTNRPATLSSSRSNNNSSRRTVRRHSNRPTRITRIIMRDISNSNNSSSTEVMAAEVGIRCVRGIGKPLVKRWIWTAFVIIY